MRTVVVCGGCGALVGEDYWGEHEAFHRRVGGTAKQAELVSVGQAGDD